MRTRPVKKESLSEPWYQELPSESDHLVVPWGQRFLGWYKKEIVTDTEERAPVTIDNISRELRVSKLRLEVKLCLPPKIGLGSYGELRPEETSRVLSIIRIPLTQEGKDLTKDVANLIQTGDKSESELLSLIENIPLITLDLSSSPIFVSEMYIVNREDRSNLCKESLLDEELQKLLRYIAEEETLQMNIQMKIIKDQILEQVPEIWIPLRKLLCGELTVEEAQNLTNGIIVPGVR